MAKGIKSVEPALVEASPVGVAQEVVESTNAVKGKGKRMIRIPADPLNPDDNTVYVGINNYSAYIQRGVDVEVPYDVYMLLRVRGMI